MDIGEGKARIEDEVQVSGLSDEVNDSAIYGDGKDWVGGTKGLGSKIRVMSWTC